MLIVTEVTYILHVFPFFVCAAFLRFPASTEHKQLASDVTAAAISWKWI